MKRIALYPMPQYRGLMHKICGELKRRYGSQIIAYGTTKQQVEYLNEVKYSGLIDEVGLASLVFRRDKDGANLDTQKILLKARAWEERLGETIPRLVMGDRTLGFGYSLGGFNYPRPYGVNELTWPEIVNIAVDRLEYWEAEINKWKFDLILNPRKELAVVARANSVPQRYLRGLGVKNYHYWAIDEYETQPGFARLLESETERTRADFGDVGTIATAAFSFLDRAASIPNLITQTASDIARFSYWSLRGYDKAKNTPLTERLTANLNVFRAARQLRDRRLPSLADLEGQDFVFYPLHEEPETALTVSSPGFLFQLETIVAVSRDLPGDTILAVKEHPISVGRRPHDFYQQIRALPNTVMIKPTEKGSRIARAACAVVTIRGTVGFEAAMAGRPVIVLGDGAFYTPMQHVRMISGTRELRPALKWALSNNQNKAANIAEAERFYAVIQKQCFELDDFSFATPDNASKIDVNPLVTALETSILGDDESDIARNWSMETEHG